MSSSWYAIPILTPPPKPNDHNVLHNIYPCTQVSTLRKHKQSKHEDIKFPCDKCEYVAPRKNTLKQHKESMHEGVRYPCDLCDYVATWKSCLNDHKKAKHQAELSMFKQNIYPDPIVSPYKPGVDPIF